MFLLALLQKQKKAKTKNEFNKSKTVEYQWNPAIG